MRFKIHGMKKDITKNKYGKYTRLKIRGMKMKDITKNKYGKFVHPMIHVRKMQDTTKNKYGTARARQRRTASLHRKMGLKRRSTTPRRTGIR